MDAQHDRILRERRLADKEARDGATDHTKDEAALEHAVHEANALLDVAHDERRASKARADADLVDVLTVDVAKLEALVSGGSHSVSLDIIQSFNTFISSMRPTKIWLAKCNAIVSPISGVATTSLIIFAN